MKLLLGLLLISNLLFSQVPSIHIIGGNDTTICDSITYNLSYETDTNILSTLSYNVEQVVFNPQSLLGTVILFNDDQVQGPFGIGFNFCFYGNQYSQFYIGSNGWIGFSGGQPVAFTSNTIPSVGAFVPKNCIMGPWYDYHPGILGAGGTNLNYIKYKLYGVSPYRRLVVTWDNIPLYQCTATRGTSQIVIYETTNIIENSIIEKNICFSWANGTATQGLHNNNGTQATIVSGRNSTQWEAYNETWRYIPSSPNPPPRWYVNGIISWIGNTFNDTFYPTSTIEVRQYYDCPNFNISDSITINENSCCDPIEVILNTD
jgi:hypothetical protein